jgi:hypothetical protein
MQITQETSSHLPFLPIDTLAISKRLQLSGVPQKQAEAQAEAQAEVFGDILTYNLATKNDIAKIEEKIEHMRKDLTTEMGNMHKDLTIEMAKIKIDMIKWVVPLMVGQLLAAVGLMKIVIHQ